MAARKPKKNLPPQNLDASGRHRALAHMIGGFVHQLRTPIHIIQSSAEDLSRQRRFMPNFKPQAELIARSAQRLEASVNALLNFVRGDAPTLHPGLINSVVEQLGDFLNDECRKHSVTVEKRLASQRPVRLDAFSLQEAFINVLMNALEAMPKGGLLTIRTEDLLSQKKVLIEFKDTGHGMDKNTLARIAKPFQTTKKTGMGLGVFFTRKILTQHHADMTLASEKGRGTTVTIVFPTV